MLQPHWPFHSSKTVSSLAVHLVQLFPRPLDHLLLIQLLFFPPLPCQSFFHLANIYSVPTKRQELFQKALTLWLQHLTDKILSLWQSSLTTQFKDGIHAPQPKGANSFCCILLFITFTTLIIRYCLPHLFTRLLDDLLPSSCIPKL